MRRRRPVLLLGTEFFPLWGRDLACDRIATGFGREHNSDHRVLNQELSGKRFLEGFVRVD